MPKTLFEVKAFVTRLINNYNKLTGRRQQSGILLAVRKEYLKVIQTKY